MRNVTMFSGGNAMVMFNSTMHESVINFCDSLGIEARTNKNGYLGVTKLINDVLGIKYLASPSKQADTMYQFERIGEDGELALYYNDNALSLGFVVKDDIQDWDIEAGEPLAVQNSFVELATGLDPIYVLDRYIDMEDGENYGIRIPENKQVYLCIDSRVAKLDLNTPEYTKSFSDYTDHLYVINATEDDDMADFTVELKSGQSVTQAEVYTCANTDYQQVIDKLSESQLTNVTVNGNRVSADLDAKEAGTLLLTIPYDTGWKLMVDGVETEYVSVGEALMGVHVEAGTHRIEMKYTPPGLWAGSALSLICVVLYLLSIGWGRRHPDWFEKDAKEMELENMEFEFSDKAQKLEAGIFALLNEKKNELEAQGKKIYNLSVGTPDFRPPQHIIDAVSEAAKKPENYKYALVELPELLQAAQGFFKRRFDLDLALDEIMSLYGSQEGMTHLAWAICNPGDLVLVPNPGYPIFKIGPELCDAEVWEYPLYEKNGFLPDLDAIPEEIARKAKLMVVSYPGNPCCKVAPDTFYEKLIAFAKKYSIYILHDNAYADLVFGGQGGSFLQYEGAKDVGIEFYSLSKTFNYTGARASFAIGNAALIQKFKALRTQFDYGTFLPVQYGAIAALNGPFDGVLEQCKEYEERNRTLCGGLREIGWDVPDSEGTMFVWAPLPKGYHNSEQFALELMEKAGVICVPGTSFGTLGEGYVRMALVLPPAQLKEAVKSIAESGMIQK
jgi:LL-diaminopimelate aminotransferase